MVVIRLARGGAKKRPFYHIVATDKQSRRDGRFIERVGFYNPVAAAGESSLVLEMDRVTYWRNSGAQMSDSVARLVRRYEQSPAAQAAGQEGRTAGGEQPAAGQQQAVAAEGTQQASQEPEAGQAAEPGQA